MSCKKQINQLELNLESSFCNKFCKNALGDFPSDYTASEILSVPQQCPLN